jgi:hypothetical protein
VVVAEARQRTGAPLKVRAGDALERQLTLLQVPAREPLLDLILTLEQIAAAAGFGPTRVHAIVRDAELDGLDTALGELRSLYGWPAPEDPGGSRDEELAGPRADRRAPP